MNEEIVYFYVESQIIEKKLHSQAVLGVKCVFVMLIVTTNQVEHSTINKESLN